jgi:hypothetical protein
MTSGIATSPSAIVSDASAIVSDASAIVSDASAIVSDASAIVSDASAIVSDAALVAASLDNSRSNPEPDAAKRTNTALHCRDRAPASSRGPGSSHRRLGSITRGGLRTPR